MNDFFIQSDISEIITRIQNISQDLSGKTVLITGARGFLGRYFIEIFKRLRGLAEENYHDNAIGILLGSSAAVLAFLVSGFFETNIYDSEVAMFLYFIMGLSLAKIKKHPVSSILAV